jgi:hypothetical protein
MAACRQPFHLEAIFPLYWHKSQVQQAETKGCFTRQGATGSIPVPPTIDQALTFQTTKTHGHTSNTSSHFKIISRTYSVPSTVLYSFRPTLALFCNSVVPMTFLATSSCSTTLSNAAAMFL